MDAAFIPVLTLLTGLALRGMALAALFLRLRWEVRQQQLHCRYLVALARTLPRGSWLDEIRPDGSELHLVIAQGIDLDRKGY